MEIESFQGMVIQIDREFKHIGDLGWGTYNYGTTLNPNWYAAKNYHSKFVLMHRLILELKLNRKLTRYEFTDHINHRTLDNRKANLRLVTPSQNSQNLVRNITKKTSQYKGPTWEENRSQWKASIKVNGKSINLGRYYDEIDAAKAYDKAAKYFQGDYAYLNFPED
jgi:hypothetical protein